MKIKNNKKFTSKEIIDLTHGPILSIDQDCKYIYIFVRAIKYIGLLKKEALLTIKYQFDSDNALSMFVSFLTKKEHDYTAIVKIPVIESCRYRYTIFDENNNELTATNCFITLPILNSEFVLYHLSDSHNLNDVWPVKLYEHYTNNYKNKPVVVLYTGDIFNLPTNESVNDIELLRAKYKELYENASFKDVFSKIPILQIWDDWDYMGDNSCEITSSSRGIYNIDRNLALQVRKEYVPNPFTFENFDDARFYTIIGETFIIVPDSRSRKSPISITINGVCNNLLNGSENMFQSKCWGQEQLIWMKSLLSSTKLLKHKINNIIIVSTQSFIDNLDIPLFPCDGNIFGIRDSLGIFHKDERNSLLRHIQELYNNNDINNLPFILTGDDHKPKITYRNFWHDPYLLQQEDPIINDINIGLYEFKAGNGGNTTRIFDSDEYPPLWFGGCDNEYVTNPPISGYGNSYRHDIGFCWEIDPNKEKISISAILFENETPCVGYSARTAPCVIFKGYF